MAKTGVRVAITLACTECKRRNYQTDQVEAQHARPRRVQEVLPLVRPSHRPPGDPVVARQPTRRSKDYQAPRALLGGRVGSRASAASRSGRSPRRRRRPVRSASARGGTPVRVGVGRRAAEDRLARPAPARLGNSRRPDRDLRRRSLSLRGGRGVQPARARRAPPLATPTSICLRCSSGMSSTPTRGTRTRSRPISSTGSSRWDEGSVPSRRRPDRAGHGDEGRAEGADREARAARVRAGQHGHDRRGVDGGQGNAGRHGLRRGGRQARAALQARGRPDPAHAYDLPSGLARSRSSSSASR